MSTVGIYVRRIHEMESFRIIIRTDHVEGIPIFNCNILQSPTNMFRKFIFSILNLLRHPAPKVITETPVQHGSKRRFR